MWHWMCPVNVESVPRTKLDDLSFGFLSQGGVRLHPSPLTQKKKQEEKKKTSLASFIISFLFPYLSSPLSYQHPYQQ
jgi:hypothetical protein